ncbi:tyrosine-type recombinase/integrase [bacterium]|nr:tyrosine-type recombinase/integrase [bacterium]
MPKTMILRREKYTWETLLDDFLLVKKVDGCRDRTLQDYRYHIRLFFKEYPNALFDNTSLVYAIRSYFSKHCAPATFNIRRENLKAYFSFLLDEGIIDKNPITFQKRKDEGKAYQIPEETIKLLLTLPDKRTFAGLRDFCLLLLTLDTGIRPKEALSILAKDINLGSFELNIRGIVSKTNSSRTLPLSPYTCTFLMKFLNTRPSFWEFNVPVFCSYNGKPMLESSWGHRLKKYSKRLGFAVAPYSLRHCFALYYLRNAGNIFTLQRTMGHTDLNMTKRYLALTQADMKEQHLTTASPVNMFVKKRVKIISPKEI